MKSRITFLVLLVCVIYSFHLLTSVEVQASQVNLELTIPEDTDDSESIIEIDRETPKINEKTSSAGNSYSNGSQFSSLPKTGESTQRFTFLGGVVAILALLAFKKKRYS